MSLENSHNDRYMIPAPNVGFMIKGAGENTYNLIYTIPALNNDAV